MSSLVLSIFLCEKKRQNSFIHSFIFAYLTAFRRRNTSNISLKTR